MNFYFFSDTYIQFLSCHPWNPTELQINADITDMFRIVSVLSVKICNSVEYKGLKKPLFGSGSRQQKALGHYPLPLLRYSLKVYIKLT